MLGPARNRALPTDRHGLARLHDAGRDVALRLRRTLEIMSAVGQVRVRMRDRQGAPWRAMRTADANGHRCSGSGPVSFPRRVAPGGSGVLTVRRASRETRRKFETWWTGRMWLDSPA